MLESSKLPGSVYATNCMDIGASGNVESRLTKRLMDPLIQSATLTVPTTGIGTSTPTRCLGSSAKLYGSISNLSSALECRAPEAELALAIPLRVSFKLRHTDCLEPLEPNFQADLAENSCFE
jgi:hypothetical protein